MNSLANQRVGWFVLLVFRPRCSPSPAQPAKRRTPACHVAEARPVAARPSQFAEKYSVNIEWLITGKGRIAKTHADPGTEAPRPA